MGRIPQFRFANLWLRRVGNPAYSIECSLVGFAVSKTLLDLGVIETDVTATQRQTWVPEGERHSEVYCLATS